MIGPVLGRAASPFPLTSHAAYCDASSWWQKCRCLIVVSGLLLGGLLLVGGCEKTSEPTGTKNDLGDSPATTTTSDADGAAQPSEQQSPVGDTQAVLVHTKDDDGVAADGGADHQADGVTRKNRLARETSPYLLQHAANPVDWYPWGDEALAKAKAEKKLIFLSIGYSSCHWCHVMERESFMDKQIAEFLNQNFVCIKVDREERPDVDAVYMAAVQVITRQGGWPLSVFLTPDAKPFFGGTYFPARDGDRPGATGFLTVIQRIADKWKLQPEPIQAGANQLAELLQKELAASAEELPPITLGADLVARTFEGLRNDFDPQYGGFGFDASQPDLPKFPQAANLFFLAQMAREESAVEARQMLVTTLDQLAMGGIRDHLGGGFHRYSVDRFWNIPHFEKMLYDNGQLASVYAEAYAMTKHEEYARVVAEMFSFLNREMSAENGGFYAALDADSEHEEGKFYRWETTEWQSALGEEGAREFAGLYASSGRPNFEEKYFVPRLDKPFRELAQAAQRDETEFQARLSPWRERLLALRDKRVRPGTDSKILTSWNGMMIRGLADAGRLMNRPEYVERAERAANFVLQSLRGTDGRLFRTFSEGEARIEAYVDDYACLIDGLIAMHRATGNQRWLDEADVLTKKQIELFWDEQGGGFFFTSTDAEALIVRGKQFADNAVPTGNSVAVENFLYLARVLERPEYKDYARRTVVAASELLSRAPHAAPRMVMAAAELQ